jgi:hypothetical protein
MFLVFISMASDFGSARLSSAKKGEAEAEAEKQQQTEGELGQIPDIT